MPDIYFATCGRGVEPILAQELYSLGISSVTEERGGVSFHASERDAYRSLIRLRCAIRVLKQVARFPASSPEQLYENISEIAFEEYLSPDGSLSVDCNIRDSNITHSKYAALKAKDAVVDRFRSKFGRRPDVDTQNPDIRVNVHIYKNEAVISLDASGEPLFKRGYRTDTVEASMNEALASALLYYTNWKPDDKQPLYDPMCGAGTLLTEAALMASHDAPGLFRNHFGIFSWRTFKQDVWDSAVQEAENSYQTPEKLFFGSDIDKKAIAAARKNSIAAGYKNYIELSQMPIASFQPKAGPGVVICNPPYGERMKKDDIFSLYKSLGDVFKQQCKNSLCYVFTGNLEAAKHIGLKASRRIVLYNGPIECRLLEYLVY